MYFFILISSAVEKIKKGRWSGESHLVSFGAECDLPTYGN